MQKIIIHLGLHKTGTTYLQECIFKNLKGVEVQCLSEICQIKFKSDKKILLISNESLVSSMPHYADNSTVEDSIEALYRIFPTAKIILGVRDHAKWFYSCWNHYVRTSGSMSFYDYHDKYQGVYTKPKEYIPMIFSRWDDVFVYTQDRLKESPQEIIKQMCKFIGVSVPPYEVTVKRKALSSNKTKVLRLINLCTFDLYSKIFHVYADVYAKIAYYQVKK